MRALEGCLELLRVFRAVESCLELLRGFRAVDLFRAFESCLELLIAVDSHLKLLRAD